MYSVLSSANEVLGKTVIEGIKITAEGGADQTQATTAFAHFAQGISLGYIGLLYDQGFISSEHTDLTIALPLSPYTEVIDSALSFLDKAIAVCASNNFNLPDTWVPGIAMDNNKLWRLANSFAARILSYSARNAEENDAINWQRVYDYAKNGIDYDFSPLADDIVWYSLYHTYANFQGWGQTDMRIINMMDPDMPAQWPGANGFDVIPAPKTDVAAAFDDRLITDFQFLSSCPFRAERGYYHFSSYRYTRRDEYLATWTTPMPDMLKAENDLLLAEAALHLNKLNEAAQIINLGTRVTRGGLPAVAENAAAIEAAIFHERNIELYCSGLGVEFFTMRKANKLQPGTFLHFPIPGQQLEVNTLDYYTFGPDLGRPGIDYSTGGWF
jgi:hypothetical protein